jgi:hypothetical protein
MLSELGKQHYVDHLLLHALQPEYKITCDWKGELYFGIVSNCSASRLTIVPFPSEWVLSLVFESEDDANSILRFKRICVDIGIDTSSKE